MIVILTNPYKLKLGVDVIHPVPVASVAFPAATVEELTALRNRVDMVEAEMLLCATIRTMEAIETVNYNHERLARIEIERQFASVQESHCQDREEKPLIMDEMAAKMCAKLREGRLGFARVLVEISAKRN
ncbi:hypothetical protein Tco_0794934 [Tanacetum coccineum]